MILAIDPGSEKCGLAILGQDARVSHKNIVPTAEISDEVAALLTKHTVEMIVIGQGAFGRALEKRLLEAAVKSNFTFIPENDSSWQARQRYWQEHPPAGWLRFIPTSLRVPPVPVDDYAAVIIGERYLKS